MSAVSTAVANRLAKIRLLISDVDGVLTDGTLFYSDSGETLKPFHVRDGMGFSLLLANGINVAVISARSSGALQRRMADLRVEEVFLGRKDKEVVFDKLLNTFSLDAQEVAYVGDDYVDLPVLRRVGLAIAVQDAHPLVKEECHWITETPGGKGAIREVADAILAVRVGLNTACERWLESTETAPKPGDEAAL